LCSKVWFGLGDDNDRGEDDKHNERRDDGGAEEVASFWKGVVWIYKIGRDMFDGQPQPLQDRGREIYLERR